MILALLAAESLLLSRLLITFEFPYRPCFTLYILFSIVSAYLYQPGFEHRDLYLSLANWSIGLQALVVIEASFWATQKRTFGPTLGFAIFFGMLMAERAALLPMQHGGGLGRTAVWRVMIGATWLMAATLAASYGEIRKRRGRAGIFELLLVLYLLIQPAEDVWFSMNARVMTDGSLNPAWMLWDRMGVLLKFYCMTLWLLTDRTMDYCRHDAVSYYEKDYKRLDRQMTQKFNSLGPPPFASRY